MKYRLLFFLLLCACFCQAQNLINNGGFELSIRCVHDYGAIDVAEGWFQQDGSSADYYNRCCKTKDFVGLPANFCGIQEVHDGDAYAGLALFYLDRRRPAHGYYVREYVQTALTRPLVSGGKYRIMFYYSLADKSVFYTDHFSVGLSTKKKLAQLAPDEFVLICENKISQTVSEADAKDTQDWHQVEFEYTAKGGEAYLAIGFFDDFTKKQYNMLIQKNRLSVTDVTEKSAYYYIDNVSVVPVMGGD